MSSTSLNSNISSLSTQRRLGNSTRGIVQSFERLSSGLRINRAADDAAGLAIADTLNTDNRVFAQGIRNLNDGLSLLNVADGALTELSNIVIRIRELAEQSANGTLSNKQREAIDQEAQELSDEFTRIAQTTEVNGLKLFDGSLGELSLQAGYGERGAVTSTLGGVIGDGTFGSLTSFQTEPQTSNGISLGDLDGDGTLDLVTAGYRNAPQQAMTSVRLGSGDGSFGELTSYAFSDTAGVAFDVITADVNNDGKLDVITAGRRNPNPDSGIISVRLGGGDGSLGEAMTYTAESDLTRQVKVGDINNDGILDLVSSGSNDDSTSSLTSRLGNGDGTFGEAFSFATEGPWAVALGDMNADGNLDAITVGNDGGQGSFSLLLGNGDGTFETSTSFATESDTSRGVVIGDLNLDGKLDVVTGGRTNANEGAITIRLGNGDGSFSAATSYASEDSLTIGVTLGDFNGDGVLDVISSGRDSNNDGRTTLRLGRGDGTFGEAVSYLTAESNTSRALFLGDINNDGVLDLVSGGITDSNTGAASVRLGSAQAGIGPLLPFSLSTKADSLQAMAPLDRKIEQLALQKGTIGAFQSRIEVAVNTLQVTSTNVKAAESRIRDVDVASESAKLTRLNILQQAGAAVLGQANVQPQIALRLLEGL